MEKAETSGVVAFDIFVDPTDVGKVIGAGGSHAYAIRQVFYAIYGRLGKKFMMSVQDPRSVGQKPREGRGPRRE